MAWHDMVWHAMERNREISRHPKSILSINKSITMDGGAMIYKAIKINNRKIFLFFHMI